MIRKKVMLVFGTRPEAMKMCPLVKELQAHSDEFDIVVTVADQHKAMLYQVYDVVGVVPEYALKTMKLGQVLFNMICNVLMRFKSILEGGRPDVALVHGDTTTSSAPAHACFCLQIPVGQVETGLCTHEIYSSWPKEFSRQAIDIVTCWHFASTETPKWNLFREGKCEDRILVAGNKGIDALCTTVRYDYFNSGLEWAESPCLSLIVAHCRESMGEFIHGILRMIHRVVEAPSDIKAIFPMHMTPVVKKAARVEFDGFDRRRIIKSLDVLDIQNFVARSYLVFTDSGGMQEGVSFLGKPVLVICETTECLESDAAGTLKLVDTDEEAIYLELGRLFSNPDEYATMGKVSNPYGDGYENERFADVLLERR